MVAELCTTVQRFLRKRMDGMEQCCGASKGVRDGEEWNMTERVTGTLTCQRSRRGL